MVVGRANSEELNVVESDEENINYKKIMLPPFYTDGVKIHQVKPDDTDSVASSGHIPDDESEKCDNKDDDKEVFN